MTSSTQDNQEIPKIIWMFWAQGYEQAPTTVKKCYQSWQKYNPHWDLRLVDNSNLEQYLPSLTQICQENTDFLNQRKALYSDVIRLNLLQKYGGVWADATCFCCKPLDEWLPEYTEQGFFAFHNVSKNRMIDTWFIAASLGSYILKKWAEQFNNFFNNYGSYRCYWHEFYSHNAEILKTNNAGVLGFWQLKITNKLREFCFRVINSNMRFPVLLLTPPLIGWGYVPYFACHYTFSQIYFADNQCRETWDKVPKLSVLMANVVGSRMLKTPVDPQVKAHIDKRESPVYKLSYKLDKKMSSMQNLQETNLYYLFSFHLAE